MHKKKTKTSQVAIPQVEVPEVKLTSTQMFDKTFDKIFGKVEGMRYSAILRIESFKDKIVSGDISGAIEWNAKDAIKSEFYVREMNKFMKLLLPNAVPESVEKHASSLLTRFIDFVSYEERHFVGDDSGFCYINECEPNCTNPFTNLSELYRHNARLQVMALAKYIVYHLKEAAAYHLKEMDETKFDLVGVPQ